MTSPVELRTALAAVVTEPHVLTDPDVVAPYAQDWTRRFHGPVAAVVRPASTEQVADVVRVCSAHGVALVPQGGNTGLVGGSVPAPDGPPMVVLSTRRLTRLDPVDAVAGQVTVGAGATLGDLHRHAAAAGWEYGVDLAARDTATVGGTIATNAGGIRVCCHGMTRRQVIGVEAVLADGSVVSHLGGLLKDTTGYDLAALLVGSEGTLGVITAARLALVHPVAHSTVALVPVRDAAHALAVVADAVPRGSRLLAAELLDPQVAALVLAVTGLPAPWARDDAHLLLVETESPERGAAALTLPGDLDAVVALDPAGQTRLWSYRERATEAIATLGVVHKFDVSVPLGSWDDCVAELHRRLAQVPEVARVLTFGHVADGNIHVAVVGPTPDDERATDVVLPCVAEFGGSISAEHGIGRAKAAYLHLSRSPAEITAMRAVKSALDPAHLLNPGVILA